MSHTANSGLSAGEALEKLRMGNAIYLDAASNQADISPAVRLRTFRDGQTPYAVIVTCSDSRVIPECIFTAGIGDLFVIRVAGNVIGHHQLGSIEYAVDHLGTRLIVVMGHTNCGAVGAAISGPQAGYVASITDIIRSAIGTETDDYRAGCLNIAHSVACITDALPYRKGAPDLQTGDDLPHSATLSPDGNDSGCVHVVGAMYHIDTGEVEFL